MTRESCEASLACGILLLAAWGSASRLCYESVQELCGSLPLLTLGSPAAVHAVQHNINHTHTVVASSDWTTDRPPHQHVLFACCFLAYRQLKPWPHCCGHGWPGNSADAQVKLPGNHCRLCAPPRLLVRVLLLRPPQVNNRWRQVSAPGPAAAGQHTATARVSPSPLGITCPQLERACAFMFGAMKTL